MNKNNILEVRGLKAGFKTAQGEVRAVRGVDFELKKGEVLGVVGESGSGKSVLMKAIMGILPDNAKVSADAIVFEDRDILSLDGEDYRKLRGRGMTMIFQDPMTALNPLIRIGKQLEEVIVRHHKLGKKEARAKALEMLTKVGISVPEERMKQYPHELSGGMRQRVLIAMALSCGAKLLIADEPTTALDVTIQAQILELLKELQKEYETSVILITHDMGVVASMCSRIMIMYGGEVMESGSSEEIFYDARHPYTKALLKAIPSLDLEEGERLVSIPGLPPSLLNPSEGCPFAPRCERKMDSCLNSRPQRMDHSESHYSYCFLNQIEGGGEEDHE